MLWRCTVCDGMYGQVDGEGMANTCLTRFLVLLYEYLQLYGRLAETASTFLEWCSKSTLTVRP